MASFGHRELFKQPHCKECSYPTWIHLECLECFLGMAWLPNSSKGRFSNHPNRKNIKKIETNLETMRAKIYFNSTNLKNKSLTILGLEGFHANNGWVQTNVFSGAYCQSINHCLSTRAKL